MMNIHIETYEDGTVCIRFNNYGFRIGYAEARKLLAELELALEDLRARESK